MEKCRERGGLIVLLILLAAFLIGAHAQSEEVKVEVGSDVILVPKYTGEPSVITWRKNSNKLVQMELKPKFNVRFYILEDRASINHTDGNLTIRKLTIEDSGLYRADVVVNSRYQYTNLTLTVQEPAVTTEQPKTKPEPPVTTLTESSTAKTTELPPKKPPVTTPTESSTAKTTELPPKKPSGLSGVVIALLVILVLIFIIIIMGLCYCFQDRPYVQPIYTCLTCGKNHYMILLFGGAYRLITCCRQGRDSDNKTGTEKLKSYIKVVIRTDGLSFVDESRGLLADHSKRIQSLCVTIFGVKPADYGNYIVEASLSNGKKSVFPIKETDDVVNIKPEGDIVTLTVPDTENVTMLVWKKDGVPQSQWTGSDLLLYANDITLGPGSVTVNNAEGRKVFKVKFQLEESPESQSIGSVTFHPIMMTGKTQITWKKEGQPVNIGGNRIQPGPNGDLTINNVTSEDKGKYIVQCNDKKLDQEFILQS